MVPKLLPIKQTKLGILLKEANQKYFQKIVVMYAFVKILSNFVKLTRGLCK
jgi:hypothetical protein